LTLQHTLASMASDRRADTEPAGEVALLEPPMPAGAPPAPIRRIGVRTGTRTVLVEVDSIDWVEAFGDYARIHVGKQTYLVSQRMHVLERLLETGGFVRIHRSLMANLSRVRELHREADGAGTVVLDGGVRLRVSRGRWEALHAALAIEEF
jgi:two-component system LytT family response regulator